MTVQIVVMSMNLEKANNAGKQILCFEGSCLEGKCGEECWKMNWKHFDQIFISIFTGNNTQDLFHYF